MHVAQIVQQTSNTLVLRVPSESTPSSPRTLTFYPSGKHHCDCPGHEWKVMRKTYTLPNHKKWCRHHTLNTLPLLEFLEARTLHYIRRGYIKAAWPLIGCQLPEHYNEEAIYCQDCPLYPSICNIHPIHYGRQLNHKPLVWKLQTAIFAHERKRALRLFKTLRRKAQEVKDERETGLPNDP